MARKFKTVTIEAEGRDRGKVFLIRELSAWDAEKWATRALLALGRSGVDIPQDAATAGLAGIMAAGLQALLRLPFHEAEPLLESMMQCVSFVADQSRTDPQTGAPISRPLVMGDAGDVDEISTLLQLRSEVAELHLGFSIAAALSKLAAEWKNTPPAPTPTSRKRAVSSSRPDSPRSPKPKAVTA